MPIFQDHEISNEYQLHDDRLPTVNDGMKFILSRENTIPRIPRDTRIWEFAKITRELWLKADCCPLSEARVYSKFQGLYDDYVRFLKKSSDSNHRKRVSTSPPLEPTRRSSRATTTPKTPVTPQVRLPSQTQSLFSPPTPATRNKPSNNIIMRKKWDEEFGEKLFDVVSNCTIVENVKNGGCFDNEFYTDQKSPRLLKMQVTKVTDEFICAEEKRKQKAARRYARQELAKGTEMFKVVNLDTIEVDEINEDDDTSDPDFAHKHPVSHYSVIQTRENSRRKELFAKIKLDKACQVTDLTAVVVMQQPHQKAADPKYLEAMSLIMSEGLSATEALKTVCIVDRVVWNQIRLLPLDMDKDYTNMRRKIKKLEGKSSIPNESSETSDNDHEEDDHANDKNEDSSVNLMRLKTELQKKKDYYEENRANVLPDRRTIRRNHHLMAVYVEKKIGDELVEHGGFCIPDGTTRNKIGEFAGMIVIVNEKMRALKGQRIGKGDQSTWADVVVHMLERLSTASNNEIVIIWESIKTMLSDLCKVNRNLAAEISKLIGSEWIPGQLFCVLHYVLAIPVAIKKKFTAYQSQIGAEKLFPETTGFEMNIDDKTVVVQILDVWMRISSIRWHGRSWNRYNSYTTFAEKYGVRNVGHMIHANRFGEFEERCAGGVYMAESWIKWLETIIDVRNTLSCYLRSVVTLMPVCIFQWAAAALIGLHVTTPFMSMLLDYKATQRELLIILPDLYEDLIQYHTSLIKFDGPAIKSLAKFWQPPFEKDCTPYGVDVMKSLQTYTDECDHQLMDKCLRAITKVMGESLKRQRGNAYGFGDEKDSEDHITKNMPLQLMDDPDATHSKPIENYFGNLDRFSSKTGPQGFDKITDDLVIKYGSDLIVEKQYEWRSKENKQAAANLKVLQNIFDKKQNALRSSGVSDPDIAIITTSNKIQRVVKQCKVNHNGPLVTQEELDDIVSNTSDSVKLNKVLDLEIRYRKFTMTKVKGDCPLFLQRKIAVDQKIKNLELLMDSQELGLKALATMVDLADVINSSTEGDEEKEEAIIETQDSNVADDINSRGDAPSNENIASFRITAQTPVSENDFIIGMFEDGFFPGQVIDDCGDKIDAIFMEHVARNNHPDRSLWRWPSVTDRQILNKACVLKICPNLDVSSELSTRRCIVFKLLNLELVSKFSEKS